MKSKEVSNHISAWLKQYAEKAGSKGFVIGISGGIDSAVTSVLCAQTGLRVHALSLPIRQSPAEFSRGNEHIDWLRSKFSNVSSDLVDLTEVFDTMEKTLPERARTFLSLANTRARLRMTTLYAFAGAEGLLVAGTGNKIEDFGIGFFTKYGDGGVDLSPIADLNKTEVYRLAEYLGVPSSIQQAKPTDGLFADGRSDEDQIGATYPELEWAMEYEEAGAQGQLTPRQQEVLAIYRQRHNNNRHKMEPIPVCVIPAALKN